MSNNEHRSFQQMPTRENHIATQRDSDVDAQAPGVLLQLNRLFTFDDLGVHYGGPPSFWKKVRPLLPVFSACQSSTVYLESAVDEFLHSMADRVCTNPSNSGHSSPDALPEDKPEYLTVSEAQSRYFNGAMSRKWWYRIIQAGKIAHYRVADTILLRAEDIDAFVADSRQESKPAAPERDAPPAETVSIPSQIQTRKKHQEDPSFFRIFPRR